MLPYQAAPLADFARVYQCPRPVGELADEAQATCLLVTKLYRELCNTFVRGHVFLEVMAFELVLDPDTALMLKVRDGDAPSFDLLLHRHRTSVVNHLYRSVRNRAIAEELAQDVFVRVYRSRERYQPEAKFTTWLFRITTNVALNWKRDSRYENSHVRLDDRELPKMELRSKEQGLEDVLLEQGRAMEIRKAVETLPTKQLAAVLMHKYEGMDYAQIAAVLECSIPALKSILFRAYQTLRQRLVHFAPDALPDTLPDTSKVA